MADVLREVGIEEPFEVQSKTIPGALEGRDVCCRAPTGSGKTLAFGIPLVTMSPKAEPKRPTSLILTPTRELAEQIRGVLKPLADSLGLRTASVYGGTPYKGQYRRLNKGVEILVACPGRLIDLLDRGALRLDDVGIVVLDEADRMADMGFMQPVRSILDKCKQDRQTILFSATLDEEVSEIVESYQHDPLRVGIGPEEVSMDSMQHFFWKINSRGKAELASYIAEKCGRSIIFCRTRAGVNRLGDEMSEMDLVVRPPVHGGMKQKQRDRSMHKFSAGQARVMIATDVASGGIDVDDVNCVIHFDPPDDGKAYKHRSGRTARAGSTGTVVSLVLRSQNRQYKRIQEEVGIRCKMTEPEPEALEEREFVRAPSEKAKFRGKTRKGQSNKKRARRSRKSSTYRSSKQGSNRRNGRRKGRGKRNNRSRGGPKRAKPRN